MTHPEQVGFHH